MVGVQAVRAGEAMPFEPGKLTCRLEVTLGHYTGAALGGACVDLDLGLDAEEDGVVHDLQVAQKVGVLANRAVHRLVVLLGEVDLLHVVLVRQKVLVLQRRRALQAPLDEAAVVAALEVVDAGDLVLVVEAQRVPHQNQVHFLVVLHLDCVHAVDAREQRCRVLLEVLVQLRQDLLY